MSESIEWRAVPGYEGLYEVSSIGDVRSIRRNSTTGIILARFVDRNYIRYSLSKEGKTKTYPGHRLVAMAFIPLIEGKKYVNHKNGIRNDNRIENLEWCTQAKNHWHKVNVLGSHSRGNKNTNFKRGHGYLFPTPNVAYTLQGLGVPMWAVRADMLINGLPNQIQGYDFVITKDGDNWVSGYRNGDNWLYRLSHNSMINSVSRLMLKLIQAKVITGQQVNNQLK